MAVLDAQGATFTIEDSGGSPVTVGGVVSFQGFDGEASEIDVTTLASTAKESRPGLQDFGAFTLELMRDPSDAGQAELEDSKANQDVRTCVLTLPGGDIATFDAYVKSLTASGGVDAVVTGSCAMKITGSVVWS